MSGLKHSIKSLALPSQFEQEQPRKALDAKTLMKLRDDALSLAQTTHRILIDAGTIPPDEPLVGGPKFPTIGPTRDPMMAEGMVIGCQFMVPDGGGMIRYSRGSDYTRNIVLDIAPDIHVRRIEK